MLRSFPGIVPDNNFTLGVVQVMHGGSRIMSKEVSTVIDGCTLCMYICITVIHVVCFIPHEDRRESVVRWKHVIRVI
jgi:hypothetical protein